MRLRLLSSAVVTVLRNNIARNLSAYQQLEPFVLHQDFGTQVEVPTPLEVNLEIDFAGVSDDIAGNGDAQNAALVHRALGMLTPAQATDERLWARLGHVEFWSYMRSRWPVERFVDADVAARFVLARYFVAQSQSRALLRNGIARLWWAAQLTIDHERDNPYELTEILLSKLDIAQQILERSIGRSRSILVAFLEFIGQNRARLLDGGESGRREIRALAKALNLSGGVSMLDAMSALEIGELLTRALNELPIADKTVAAPVEVGDQVSASL